MDPIKVKEQQEQRLADSIADKKLELIELINKVNTAKDKAKESIKKMSDAVEQASKEFMDWTEQQEVFQLKVNQLAQEIKELEQS